MPKLIASVRERASLSPDEVAAMYALFEAYYDCTSFALFAADLQEKSHVILFTDNTPGSGPLSSAPLSAGTPSSGIPSSETLNSETLNSGTPSSETLNSGTPGYHTLCGFSTLTLLQLPGAPWRVLFSGDTIIDHAHWGEQALALEFCRFAGQIKASAPDLPLYWFLISKGYRTYRYLHLFAREYWPGFANDMGENSLPAANASALEAILHQVASSKFGDAWDRRAGLIRFPHSRGQLRADWAGVRENLRQRPEVAYFLNKNPRYAEGEELACITLLDESNLRSVARRAFVEGLHANT